MKLVRTLISYKVIFVIFVILEKLAADNAQRRNLLVETHTMGRKPVALVVEQLVSVFLCASLLFYTILHRK